MKYLLAIFTIFLAPIMTAAQTQQPVLQETATQQPTGYSFAVVVASKVLTVEGDWKQSTRLRDYATTRAGTYIVFATGNGLSVLTSEIELSKVVDLYQEVARLGKEQSSLEAKQSPLSKQQEKLAAEMRKALTPEEMRRIGAEQGKIGTEQGTIGREQGKIGQEQGIAGRKFYDAVQACLRACTADHSCAAA